MTLEQQTVGADNKITVTQQPVAFADDGAIIGWYKKSTEDDTAFTKFTFDTGAKTATLAGTTQGDIVCIKYVVSDASAKKFVVNADFIPAVVRAVMTIGLYKAGTTKETISSSSKIGELVVDVPNFQLGGAVELSLTSTGIASTPLSGSALATFGGNAGCSDHGYYAIITERVFNSDEFASVSNIVVSNSDLDMSNGDTETLRVYKMYNDGTQPAIVDNSKLTFTVTNGTGVSVGTHTGIVTATATGTATITVTVTDHTNLSATATAVVA